MASMIRDRGMDYISVNDKKARWFEMYDLDQEFILGYVCIKPSKKKIKKFAKKWHYKGVRFTKILKFDESEFIVCVE